jgi:hypothetical protein
MSGVGSSLVEGTLAAMATEEPYQHSVASEHSVLDGDALPDEHVTLDLTEPPLLLSFTNNP